MTNTIADIEEADVILITGSNTTENHPVLSTFVKRAVNSGGQTDRGGSAAHQDDGVCRELAPAQPGH
jgi:NADH dehydrogenase/NADH:ubiquinone oxidoreductase subunit G